MAKTPPSSAGKPADPKGLPPNPADDLNFPTNSDPVTAQFESQRGNGDELQQVTRPGDPARMTTNHGVPISDNENSLRMGARGPTLLEDFALREKIFHFDHERIPERIVHARGSAAHGVFEVTEAIPEFTRAALFQKAGNRCDVFVRFSTVAGGAGSVDTPRDVRGFATKFYTPEGNWDLVGNNIPVFFIQDAMKFPDLVHSVKMEADRAYPQAATAHDTFWDWISLMPEAMHMIMWAMSDRAIPRSFRMMEGFGVHTFRLVNAEDKATFVKFHWKPRLGIQSLVWDESAKLQGADNDFHRRDLFESIAAGHFPQWDLGIQTFDAAFADAQPYDVLDATKLIPEEDCPVRLIGTMTLNRNPDNFFAETEQAAFLPSNVVPGIDFSDDPLLQGRLFSYLDTQKSRLGTTNFHQIPINAPRCPMHNFQRDGMMQTQIPKGRANYEPNSLGQRGEIGGPRVDAVGGYRTIKSATDLGNEPTEKLRIRAESFADHFSQARLFYKSQTETEQGHMVSALIFELSKVEIAGIREAVLAQIQNIDMGMAQRVANGLAMDLPPAAKAAVKPVDMKPSDKLSILKQARPISTGRKLGILVTDGIDKAAVDALKSAAEAGGAAVTIVAPKIGGVTLKDGSKLPADARLDGTPSVVFDAVAIVASAEGGKQLAADAAGIDFAAFAWAHLKAIAASPEAQPLLDKANVGKDDFILAASDAKGVVDKLSQRAWAREPQVRPQF
ncbi:catalase [Paracoccus suum]|uniref:Catalase n=1 Tax=Paracoccus suum TaxID=2259340 RepID=A0A344PHL0_9RHOB|nr:catalase [Paracoccus suum]AXC48865.1 catalase [Paracoccus suum]